MGCTTCTEPQCLYKVALYLYLLGENLIYFRWGPINVTTAVHAAKIAIYYTTQTVPVLHNTTWHYITLPTSGLNYNTNYIRFCINVNCVTWCPVLAETPPPSCTLLNAFFVILLIAVGNCLIISRMLLFTVWVHTAKPSDSSGSRGGVTFLVAASLPSTAWPSICALSKILHLTSLQSISIGFL